MKRFALAMAAIAALSLPASAQTPNCESDFKAFLERMAGQGAKNMTGKELAEIYRVAVRGYDACTSGDQRFDAKNFFDKLGGGGSKPEDVFTQSMVGQGAKK